MHSARCVASNTMLSILSFCSQLAADPEPSVKNSVEQLDCLLQDVVIEFAVSYAGDTHMTTSNPQPTEWTVETDISYVQCLSRMKLCSAISSVRSQGQASGREHNLAPQKPKEYLLLVRDRASGGKMAGAPTSRNLAKASLGQGQKR